MGQPADDDREHSPPGARRSSRTIALVAAGAFALVAAGFTGHAIGAGGDPGESPSSADAAPPYELAFAESCAALTGPAAALDVATVVDADAVSAVEDLVAALPEELSGQGATVLATYRAVADGDLNVLADDATIAEADAAAAAIVEFLDRACGLGVSGG